MREKWMRRAVVAVAFTAALALAVPAQAAGWSSRAPGSDLFDVAWQWIARLWVVPEAGSQPASQAVGWTKSKGNTIDPDGAPNAAVTSDPDMGNGIDPDG